MADEDEIVNISDNDDDCVLEAVVCNEICEPEFIYDNVYNECPCLAKIIEKCLTLENSKGMSRVINKTLLGIYKETDAKYIISSEFKQVLKNTLVRLNKDPYHRFSHIKALCEILRENKYKKRVQLTTLKHNIRDLKMSRPTLKRSSSLKKNTKILKSDVTDLDMVEIPVIIDSDPEKCDSNPNDLVVIDDNPISIEDEKENYADKEESFFSNENSIPKLLVPHNLSDIDEDKKLIDIERVKNIEHKIATYKEMIAKLDEEEVTGDDSNSPYIKSERLKVKIVSLYEELCEHTGTKPVKTRKIRLQVIEGHSISPVQRLESFLNKNIGSNGDPPFPDFCDVVKCVIKANGEDNLGWNKHQILQEASALFTHCGRALQKSRQERELRDLRSRVEIEKWNEDPADEDPQLLAKLQANKKAAMRKEAEILERFSMMQSFSSSSSSCRSVPNNSNNNNKLHVEHFSYKNAISSNENGSVESLTIYKHDSEDSSSYKSDSEESSSDRYEKNNQIETTATEIPKNNINYSSSDANDKSCVEDNTEIACDEVKLKREPTEDIVQLLNELGDNYSVSITDIEDPFLIIEISDSSDED